MEQSPMAQSAVITRFAPSPTGFLHIGGARTALFNWLYARHHQGQFLLRIEDTDKKRSSEEATAAIYDGLRWLGLDWDGEAVSQAANEARHREVAEAMLANGSAYRCFASQEEVEAAREKAKAEGRSIVFRSPWRDKPADQAPDAPYVVRLKAPLSGETTISDAVQGEVSWKNDTLDDLILLRSDGSPTYMLAVVVDDHDMGVTHVIRGDDHLTNAARQRLIYEANGWPVPIFAHIPLIHGPDGAKLSKRHGALGIEAYREMGYLPAGMRNYLARLGWSHGDDEIFTTEQATEWFGLEAIGKAPARIDFSKMENVNGQHMRMSGDDDVLEHYLTLRHMRALPPVSDTARERLSRAMPALRERAKTLLDIDTLGAFAMAERPLAFEDKARAALDADAKNLLLRLTVHLRNASWNKSDLEDLLRSFANDEGVKLGKVAQPLRAAVTGCAVSPGAFDVIMALGKDETLDRLDDVTNGSST
ncbi:MAG: glutamate--tRNA ligase [Neomegalonema sp.]|nr:glutamate--tRNA ligase [Neomegalonema sp.]